MAETKRVSMKGFMYNILLVLFFGVQYKLVIYFFYTVFDFLFVEKIYFSYLDARVSLGRKKRLFGYFRLMTIFFQVTR